MEYILSFECNYVLCEEKSVMKYEEKQFEGKKKKIKKILNKALETEYYAPFIRNLDIDTLTYEEFTKIPVLNKPVLNENILKMFTSKYSDFNVEYYNSLEFSEKKKYLYNFNLDIRVTSGSTGVPVEVIKSKDDINRDYITLNLYRRKLTKYNFKGNFLWIWPVNIQTKKYFYPDEDAEVFWQVNNHGTQYMLYAYSDKNLEIMYNYIIDNNVEWITSSPNALIKFISYLEKNNLKIEGIKYIECHSEYLYDWQREKICDAFKCDISTIYSSNEVQFMGGAKKEQTFQLFDKGCFIEFIDNNKGGKNICVTSLNYLDVPIIRYNLGDCGEWVISDENNDDGCYYFKLKQYRENDYLIDKNGEFHEPFIITDSIVLIKNTFNINIDLYRVIQVDVNVFEYYFDSSVKIGELQEIKIRLEKYLSDIFGYEIKVKILFTDINEVTFYGTKFKYIEVDAELRKKLANKI